MGAITKNDMRSAHEVSLIYKEYETKNLIPSLADLIHKKLETANELALKSVFIHPEGSIVVEAFDKDFYQAYSKNSVSAVHSYILNTLTRVIPYLTEDSKILVKKKMYEVVFYSAPHGFETNLIQPKFH